MLRPYPDKLFKYMRMDVAEIVLGRRTIRFTQPDSLNDPYECHLTLDRAARAELVEGHHNFLREQEPKTDEETLRARALANEASLVETALIQYRRIRESLGILSLSETHDSLLMWSHYADEHRGVVIELDHNHPSLMTRSDGDSFAGFFSVDYRDEKVRGVPTPATVVDTLLVKSKPWSYEREWRFIRTLDLLKSVADGIYVAEIDPDAIKRVILGARFPTSQLERIAKLKSQSQLRHVVFEKAVILPHRFGIKTVDSDRFGWTLLHREHYFGEVAAEALLCIPMEDDEADLEHG
jgi:Protein of unknown function (DUF2971)